jgi:ribonuclease R
MHRLGDVVDVRLVEAAPVAGALRFELLGETETAPRERRRGVPKVKAAREKAKASKVKRETGRKADKKRAGKVRKGKSWKR